MPAAKMGDKVQGLDIHIIMIPTPGGPVPTPLPHPFAGTIMQETSTDVMIENKPAATVNSIATNLPPHIPQGGSFAKPPANQGTVIMGSATVLINGKPAARMGDTVLECNDPIDAPTGSIICSSTVLIGGPSAPSPIEAGGGAQLTEQSFVKSEKSKEAGPTGPRAGEDTTSQKGKGSLNVLCVNSEGEPVANCDYEIILAGGQSRKGKTNSEGRIIEDNVDPGQCEVHIYPK